MSGDPVLPNDETIVDLPFDNFESPAPQETMRASGTQFGKYRLLQMIGQGGMGVVYKARHGSLDRLVALKILRSQHQRPEDLKRFENEARAAAQLVHPGIARIHDVGEADGQHYLAQELIDGVGLERMIADGRLEPRRSIEIVASLAEAVDYAHERGVIHRDLKPSNVLIDAQGLPRLTDFGLARRMEGQGLTQTGQVLGTPAYMAPEQVSGERGAIGKATDVHGLGAILYELLAGDAPFRGESIANALHRVLNENPVSPSELFPDVPESFSQVCLRCLAKKPADRYPTAGELALDCRQLLAGLPIAADPARQFTPVAPTRRGRRRAGPLPAAGARQPRVVALALLVLGVVFAAGVLVGFRWRGKDRAPAKVTEQREAPPPRDVKQRYVDALVRNDKQQAFAHLSRYLALHPTDWVLRSKRAELARELKLHGEAVRELEALEGAAKLNEGEAETLLVLYLQRKQLEQAMVLCQRVFSRNSQRGPGLALQLASGLEQQKQLALAIKVVEQAVRRSPHPDLWRRLAQLKIAAGTPLVAARALLRVPAGLEDPDPGRTAVLLRQLRPKLFAKLSPAFINSKLLAAHWKLLLALAARDPQYYFYQLVTAQDRLAQKDHEGAVKALDYALKTSDDRPSARMLQLMADLCLKAGREQEAARVVLKIPRGKQDPDPDRTRKLLLELRSRLSRPGYFSAEGMTFSGDLSDKAMQELLRRMRSRTMSNQVFRDLLCQLGERDPEFYYYRIAIGYNHFYAGEMKPAVQQFNEALRLGQNQRPGQLKEIYTGRAQCLQQLGQYRQALADSRWLIEHFEDEYETNLSLRFDAQLGLKQQARARRTLTLLSWLFDTGYQRESQKRKLLEQTGSDRLASDADVRRSYRVGLTLERIVRPLVSGDIVLGYNGRPIRDGKGLRKALESAATLTLQVERSGKKLQLRLTPGRRKVISWEPLVRILDKDQ